MKIRPAATANVLTRLHYGASCHHGEQRFRCFWPSVDCSGRRAIRPCSREDSNLHGLPHTVLSRTRLPIPPRELKKFGPLNCAAISRAQAEMTRYGLALNLSAPSFARPRFQLLRLAGFAQRTEQVGVICSHDFVILWRLIGRFFPTLERCAVKLGCFWIIAAGMIDDRQIAFRLGNVGMC